jgi:RNA polymerase sigma-70 factor (ECF subfamily)
MILKDSGGKKDRINKQRMNGTLETTAGVSLSKQKSKEFIGAYDQWAEKLFRFAYYKVSSRELAQDLVSQTFLKTWDYLGRGNEVRDWRLFLYRTLKNLIIDYYRSRDTKETAVLSDFKTK